MIPDVLEALGPLGGFLGAIAAGVWISRLVLAESRDFTERYRHGLALERIDGDEADEIIRVLNAVIIAAGLDVPTTTIDSIRARYETQRQIVARAMTGQENSRWWRR